MEIGLIIGSENAKSCIRVRAVVGVRMKVGIMMEFGEVGFRSRVIIRVSIV